MSDLDPQVPITKTPTTIRTVSIQLDSIVQSDSEEITYQAALFFTVDDQNGQQMAEKRINLTPHLSATQKVAAKKFVDEIRGKVESTLPAPESPE